MADQSTHIATLAAELSDLWAEIRRADDAELILPDTHVVSTFRDEASVRAHRLEDYILTCPPQSLSDVTTLLSLLLPMVVNIQIEDKDVPVAVHRTMVEILRFLERQNSKPAGDDFEEVVNGRRPRTWREEVVHVRAQIERERTKNKPAASSATAD